jgi:4-hydroxy-2-oxoheptanedioate aldolase
VDAGAQGVLVPYVETPEQVREVVGAAKFRPLKGEAVRRAVETGTFPSKEAKRHLEELNRNNVLVIGIESIPAVERLERLITVPGVDAAFVGPNDLSIQLGIPNKYDHPKFVETLTHIHNTCRKHGVPLVIHLFNHNMASHWIRRGVHFVLFGTDRRALSEGFHADFEALRHINGHGKPAKANRPHARPRLKLVKGAKGGSKGPYG